MKLFVRLLNDRTETIKKGPQVYSENPSENPSGKLSVCNWCQTINCGLLEYLGLLFDVAIRIQISLLPVRQLKYRLK